jgi:hypothetical protein
MARRNLYIPSKPEEGKVIQNKIGIFFFRCHLKEAGIFTILSTAFLTKETGGMV